MLNKSVELCDVPKNRVLQLILTLNLERCSQIGVSEGTKLSTLNITCQLRQLFAILRLLEPVR